MRKKLIGIAVLALVLAVVVGCSGGGEEPQSAPQPDPAVTDPPADETGAATTVAGAEPQAGGVFRVGVENSFGFTSGFDPTGEYYAFSWAIQSNLLLRTLVGFPHIAGPAGNQLIPDLAVDLPEVSVDGLTWTVRLKDGIKFGPPVDREILSKDVLYAFERIGTPSVVAQYGFYFDVIEGMAEFAAGEAGTISGIQTPDDKTIVFKLNQPTGDFGFRLTMPATAPIPEEVSMCFTQAGEYGRYVVSSGPYMIEGSEDLDIGSCETMRPISGYDPNASLVLVRNPNYDPATDTPAARENFPDRFEFILNTNNQDIFDRVRSGLLEDEYASVTPPILREYAADPELEGRLKVNPADFMTYVTMNLSQPPFDDIHVRRAMNLVLDKESVRRVQGGEVKGDIATHVVPDTMLNGVLDDYDPYPTPGFGGDVEAAKAEMRLSRYDADKDGICDAAECAEILNISETTEATRAVVPPIEESLARIGLDLETRYFDDAFTIIQEVAKNVPLATFGGWVKDYADASTFMVLFDSRSIIASGNINYSLVGLTSEQAKMLEGLEGNVEGIPSVDADIDACGPLTGDERVTCWAELDRKIMEEIVPWVPLVDRNELHVVGPAVTKWEYDQASSFTAYAHVAVDPSRQ